MAAFLEIRLEAVKVSSALEDFLLNKPHIGTGHVEMEAVRATLSHLELCMDTDKVTAGCQR